MCCVLKLDVFVRNCDPHKSSTPKFPNFEKRMLGFQDIAP